MYLLLSFFTIFAYQIFDVIMIANVIFYIILFYDIFRNKSLRLKKDHSLIIWFLLFILWATLSTAFFAFIDDNFSFRTNIVPYLFTLQYFIFIIFLDMDLKYFEKWLFRFCVFLSLFIICLFVIKGEYKNIYHLYSSGRLWANNIIPGWPNSTPIPLLFGLWVAIKEKKPRVYSLSLIIALMLTTSRTALLGIIIVFTYFLFKRLNKNKLELILTVVPSIVISLLFFNDIVNFIYSIIPRITFYGDRYDIFSMTLNYVSIRPFAGFGSTSLDHIINIYGNISRYGANWGHTHNWILEILLKYGTVGLLLFIGFISSIISKIKDRDKQFMFLLILVLSLFQIYIRDFTILFLMVYLTMEPRTRIKEEQILK